MLSLELSLPHILVYVTTYQYVDHSIYLVTYASIHSIFGTSILYSSKDVGTSVSYTDEAQFCNYTFFLFLRGKLMELCSIPGAATMRSQNVLACREAVYDWH